MSDLAFIDPRLGIDDGGFAGDGVPVQGVRREYELRLRPQLQVSEDDIRRVHTVSAELTAELRRILPSYLRHGSGSAEPSFWDCYGELFRSWTVAPLLANVLIAKRAIERYSPEGIIVVEDGGCGEWWSFRPALFAAAREASKGTRIQVHARPSAALRTLRTAVGPMIAAVADTTQQLVGADARRRRHWMKDLPEPRQADVLFLPVGDTSVPIIDRLAPELNGKYGLSAAAILSNPADAGMEQKSRTKVQFQYIDNFHGGRKSWLSDGARRGRAMTGWPWWLWQAERYVQPFQFRHLWPALRNRLAIAIAKDSPQMLADIEAAGRMLDAYRPQVIVAFHLYWYRTAPIVLAARARGIPTVYVQHGLFLAKDDCIRPLPFDEYLVFGEAPAEALRKRIPDGDVSAVGHCLYDELFARVEDGDFDAAGTPQQSQKTVLLATQPDETQIFDVTDDDWWVKKVAEACEKLQARLVIKLHPSDVEVNMYHQLAKQMPQTVAVAEHGTVDLTQLIADANCLVTRDSTVVLQANIMHVPVMIVNVTGNADRFPFVDDGGAVGVYRTDNILPILRDTLQSGADSDERTKKRRRFLRRHVGPSDGTATDRITAVIARCAGTETGLPSPFDTSP